ncbi:loganic acid O-methyltransferase-like [Alnus glutinosa]|uniref:loganic acid O-methyltransferase-like n=1 Tax=Alnus glutinosa TaxID=3517 RepID=UPI002D790333|nr:loganic acid O-methyltransferase-like [Alnus glutinosa]
MAAEQTSKPSEAYPMKGGDSNDSYSNNSSYQRGVIDTAKELITESVAEKLDATNFLSSTTFRIADLGCSTGPNTFFAVQNIIEAVRLKYECQGLHSQLPEFQVFFNDHVSNDFNTLFASLPPDRQYYAGAVAGSFYSRLFPNASLHFVHASYAIHWLSGVPKSIIDKTSPAWNKGRIYCANSKDEVVKAYETQFAEDMECFLQARAQELVTGGLIALVFCGRRNGTLHSQTAQNMAFSLFESCLADMVRTGKVGEEEADSFNMPVYHMSPEEVEAAVDGNGCFSIERMEELPPVAMGELGSLPKSQIMTSRLRAATEGLIKTHFGDAISNDFFDSVRKKLDQQVSFTEFSSPANFFALLKRKARD